MIPRLIFDHAGAVEELELNENMGTKSFQLRSVENVRRL